MKKFSIQELAEELKLSYLGTDKKVKKLLNEQSLKDKIKLIKEFENGRNIKKVLIDDNLLVSIKPEHSSLIYKVKDNIKEENLQFKEENKQLNSQLSIEFVENTLKELIATKNQLINYAEQVGQVKLLTDSENKTKDEYFRLVQENAILNSQLNELKVKINTFEVELQQLKTENINLTEENTKLKEKKFFGIRLNK